MMFDGVNLYPVAVTHFSTETRQFFGAGEACQLCPEGLESTKSHWEEDPGKVFIAEALHDLKKKKKSI